MPKTLKNKKHKRKNKTRKIKEIVIDSNFESGNIIQVKPTINNNVHLEIRGEKYEKKQTNKYRNWFYFKAKNVNHKTKFTIHDLKNFDDDWKGYTVCYSYDNKNWKRLPTKIDFKKLKMTWKINPKKSTIWFAYYVPYPYSRSKKLFKSMKVIGRSVKGRPIHMKKIGSGKTKVWLVSGQHPGETINSWILEGFVKRIMERKMLLKKYTFFIIPNANPDGNINGNWYTTSQGYNMNRNWFNNKSKEVKIIKKQLSKNGYDLVFDLHGDEGCKNHFLVARLTDKHPLHDKINKALNKRNKHFQLKNFYNKEYMKSVNDTLDDFTGGITVEGALKHPLRNNKTLQDEPLKIGYDIAEVLAEI